MALPAPSVRVGVGEVTPPHGGGGGGGSGGCASTADCNCLVDLGPFTKGAGSVIHPFTFTNVDQVPITITAAKLDTATPAEWTADLSQLTGTLQPGETRNFAVTFHPPAK